MNQLDMLKMLWAQYKAKEDKALADAVNIIIMLVVVGVAGWIGLLIMDEVHGQASLTSGSPFYTASTNITGAIQTGYGLVTVIIIVAIAGVIIGYLFGFVPGWGGGGQQGGGGL